VQYNEQSRSVSSNVRLGWLATAGTGLFIVYNDLEQLEMENRPAMRRGPLERALIIKFTRQLDLR
jgi:hypothetical protein